MILVIKLNNSEQLAFFGFFGLFFSMPNFYQIWVNSIFPLIIENSKNFTVLFKISYVILLILITYESINWAILLIRNVYRTKYLPVDYDFYLFKIFISGVFGILIAIFLNMFIF